MLPWLVVGLGNPGPTYAGHRHNVGFLVVEELARRTRSSFAKPKGIKAELAESRLGPPGADGPRLGLTKSRSYMNETGGPVSRLLAYYKIAPDRLVVVHDELDLDPGQLRVKFGGGDNGHNGLRSIRSSTGTGDYFRVRVGVGRPPGRQDPADFLLSNFSAREREGLGVEVVRAADAVESLVQVGLERTQSAFNS
ncbi:aminoacyl-tRNA hydrolase [Microlunatus capsulatus]|jgi:PTH1 family peptidyl-tRNA hydrolase|uniref:Peptidyl-tRNA hydrolase n=1 Tax=Microlunatus capsulatus TaxID=99117 RepID=A0ABS4ZAM0_9ACTN|nr:aminoacyl-tRNA hydrolase [Microlunatus capsulatus]MBP2418102.1 PTH1 family peptidyl-tRNA hydrolase [Microlunatus capsulatus]